MSTEKDIFEWIEQYLDQELDQQAMQAFQQRLDADPAFAKQYQEQAALRQLSRITAREHLKAQLLAGQEVLPSINQPLVNKLSLYRWAAAIALLLVAGLALWFLLQAPTPEDLYAEYLGKPQIHPPNEHLGQQETSWDQAVQAFEAGAYQQALSHLDTIAQTGPYQDYAMLAMAKIYLLDDRPRQAIQMLQNISGQSEVSLQLEAQWYLALAYLRTRELRQSQVALERIQQMTQNEQLRLKAQRLHKQIEALYQ